MLQYCVIDAVAFDMNSINIIIKSDKIVSFIENRRVFVFAILFAVYYLFEPIL